MEKNTRKRAPSRRYGFAFRGWGGEGDDFVLNIDPGLKKDHKDGLTVDTQKGNFLTGDLSATLPTQHKPANNRKMHNSCKLSFIATFS
jgi:hypothetical protein